MDYRTIPHRGVCPHCGMPMIFRAYRFIEEDGNIREQDVFDCYDCLKRYRVTSKLISIEKLDLTKKDLPKKIVDQSTKKLKKDEVRREPWHDLISQVDTTTPPQRMYAGVARFIQDAIDVVKQGDAPSAKEEAIRLILEASLEELGLEAEECE